MGVRVGRVLLQLAVVSIAACWLQPGSASAAVFKYVYSGNVLVSDAYGAYFPTYAAFSGEMWVDEAELPGGTLVGAAFSGGYGPANGADTLEYAISWLKNFTIYEIPSVSVSWLMFRTDENRRLVSWDIFIQDGPPDLGISNGGDWIYFPVPPPDDEYSAPPGSWSDPSVVPQVPAPPALALLLGAIYALGLLRLRTRL